MIGTLRKEMEATLFERRAGRRVALRCQLSILRGPQDARDRSTTTENLSSHGFCCVVEDALAAGDQFACILRLRRRPDPPACRALRCEARVVWVRLLDDGRFGIGCRIEDYNMVE
jgi:hypothetical protein